MKINFKALGMAILSFIALIAAITLFAYGLKSLAGYSVYLFLIIFFGAVCSCVIFVLYKIMEEFFD